MPKCEDVAAAMCSRPERTGSKAEARRLKQESTVTPLLLVTEGLCPPGARPGCTTQAQEPKRVDRVGALGHRMGPFPLDDFSNVAVGIGRFTPQ